MMRTIQEIFNVVIAEGFYSNMPIYSKSSWYMCEALHLACVREHITEAEKHMAVEAIKMYLRGYVFLGAALRGSDLPYKFKDRMAVYKDWANRPQITGTKYEQES